MLNDRFHCLIFYNFGVGNVGGFFNPRFSVATQTFLRRLSEPVWATGLSGV